MTTTRRLLSHFVAPLVASAVAMAVVLMVVVRRFPMQLFEESYAMYRYAREVTTTPGPRAPVLLVGDSRLKAAVIAEKLDPEALSLTLPGGSPIELYFTVDRYLQTHPTPERVLLGFSAVHFFGSMIFWERTVKFDYLDAAQFDEVFATAARLGDATFGSSFEARSTFLMEHWNAPHIYFPDLRAALFHPHGRANARMLGDLFRRHGHTLFGTDPTSHGMSYETTHPRFVPAPTFDHYFRRLLDRMVALHVPIAYAAMPLNAVSRDHLTPAFVGDYEKYFAEIRATYPSIAFETDWPIYPDDHFGDPNHLNAKGAERMTREVADRLAGKIEPTPTEDRR